MNAANAGTEPATNTKDTATVVADVAAAGEASVGAVVGSRQTCRLPTTRRPG